MTAPVSGTRADPAPGRRRGAALEALRELAAQRAHRAVERGEGAVHPYRSPQCREGVSRRPPRGSRGGWFGHDAGDRPATLGEDDRLARPPHLLGKPPELAPRLDERQGSPHMYTPTSHFDRVGASSAVLTRWVPEAPGALV